jgi:hypothetical protein
MAYPEVVSECAAQLVEEEGAQPASEFLPESAASPLPAAPATLSRVENA